ncbi:N-6 DNA methylase [Mesorhizobium sp. 1M-11]|uniref:HsdM family class I SAM-dependent methyltransferase n=1 Tax=Mesorhizobium sp. 1M-11 TaxID=1529006 RepID=UPI0006C74AFF|nr:N-6 DNA methylase [Mesorhizobium sp. 1M-11]
MRQARLALHTFARQFAADIQRFEDGPSQRRLTICEDILLGRYPAWMSATSIEYLRDSSQEERHYIVGALYAQLMPAKRRQRLSAYFTPPEISQYIVEKLVDLGLDVGKQYVIDPACGGAAFLVPVAKKIVDKFGSDRDSIIKSLNTLVGLEIEPGLASLSAALIGDALGVTKETVLSGVIRRVNSLTQVDQLESKFDAVVSNPPYGRVYRSKDSRIKYWSDVITDGHVNSYSLFVYLSIKIAKPGGLVSLLIPTSFLGGPYFKKLRQFIRGEADIISVDFIQKRSDTFLDVVQDTCILFLRKKKRKEDKREILPSVHLIAENGESNLVGEIEIPSDSDGVWILPFEKKSRFLSNTSFFDRRFYTLSDYGYIVRTGYFVWNRNKEKLVSGKIPEEGEFPLIWAENIKADVDISLAKRKKTSGAEGDFHFVKISPTSPGVVRRAALMIQRTTNKHQLRRLIVGRVSNEIIDKYGGFVGENHTIIIEESVPGTSSLSLGILMSLLNSDAVDRMYRRISGTATVSTKLLRFLPLPNPKILIEAIASVDDLNSAIEIAYEKTIAATLT